MNNLKNKHYHFRKNSSSGENFIPSMLDRMPPFFELFIWMKFKFGQATGSQDSPRKISCSGKNAGFGENAQGKAHLKDQDDLMVVISINGILVLMNKAEKTSNTTTMCCLIRGTTTKEHNRGEGGSKMPVAIERCPKKTMRRPQKPPLQYAA